MSIFIYYTIYHIYPNTMEYQSIASNYEIMQFAAKQLELEIILSEVNWKKER